uniref:IMD domain-containing protein n=1 Tax=Gopherus evgoodei TaxID=1825980 RepID=A0A8C4Y2J1_9SAUR
MSQCRVRDPFIPSPTLEGLHPSAGQGVPINPAAAPHPRGAASQSRVRGLIYPAPAPHPRGAMFQHRVILDQFNPGLKSFVTMGKSYQRALSGVTVAAKGYFDTLVKLGELASDSQGSKELGDTLFQMAEVHRQIQVQLEETVSIPPPPHRVIPPPTSPKPWGASHPPLLPSQPPPRVPSPPCPQNYSFMENSWRGGGILGIGVT